MKKILDKKHKLLYTTTSKASTACETSTKQELTDDFFV